MNIRKGLIGIYVIIGVITFSYAAATFPDTRPSRYSGTTINHDNLDKVMAGAWGGAFWPLYWSWTLMENLVNE